MSPATRTGDKGPGFHAEMVRAERRHQFFSRALGWVIALLLLAIALLGLVAARQQLPHHPDCRAAARSMPQAIEPMRLELARNPAEVRQLLRDPADTLYAKAPPYTEAMCVEARIAQQRALFDLDGAVFIPLYLLLGLAALTWYYVMALRARGNDWARRGRVPRALTVGLLVSAVLLGVTAVLDAVENQAAHAVLDLALGGLAPDEIGTATWRTAVENTREASIAKWAAMGAWAGSLAFLAGLRRRSLSLPRGSARRRRWSAGIAWLQLASATVAVVALAAGAAWAAAAGSEASNDAARGLFGIGFAVVFVHAALLFLQHRLHLPARLTLATPAGQAPPTGPTTMVWTETERVLLRSTRQPDLDP